MTEAEIRKDIKECIELSELFIKDIEKAWKSYAKKALEAKQERERKQEKKGFLEYETKEELIEAYGYDSIDEETYYRGLEYFENLKKPPELTIIEKHRERLKKLIDVEKGTIIELKAELEPEEKKHKENAFERAERLEREEKLSALRLNEALRGG